MKRADILHTAEKCVCGQREQDYGSPENNFQTIADFWSVYKGVKFSASDVATLKMDSPNFKQFCDELAPFNEMEHEVELMTAKYDEVAGNLSGEEILAIDWMLED